MLTAAAASLAACAGQVPPQRAVAGVPVVCRAVVDGDGRPMPVDRIHWDRLSEADDRERLDLSCGAVGPAVVAAPEASAPSVRAAMDDVVVVTWNMHGDAGDLSALVNSIRTGGPGQPPPSHVVMLLQEAVRASALVPATIPLEAAVPRGK